jgi:hypothetical protein
MSRSINIDDEWENFISTKNSDDISDEENDIENINEEYLSANLNFELGKENTSKCSEIYISTKTKIAYLNKIIDLKKIFWSIPIIPYAKPQNGVIKKQMKFNSTTQEELNEIQEKLENENYYDEYIMTSINNPSGRIKFKDIRKISIGISKKDLVSYRCKKKSAFYNCFVIILRIKIKEIYKEFHVKVFNTGKLEIPGIQTEEIFYNILEMVTQTLQPYLDEKLEYIQENTETVLINSNFNCGFYINREALFDILKYKYNIQSIYDPCSYPGIQCKFYYDPEVYEKMESGILISEENKSLYKNVSEVSFMIFRTGSVLIVGKCDEKVLLYIYDFLKKLLNTEYNLIGQKNMSNENIIVKDKSKKLRKKQITITIEKS